MVTAHAARRWLVPAALLALAAGAGIVALRPDAPAESALPTPLPVVHGRLDFVRTGRVETYRPAAPTSVAILLSGDGGWSRFTDAMATRLASSGALVLGIDTTRYLGLVARGRGACHAAGADFQMLAQFAQEQLGIAAYREPVVIGYSAGATLAYLAVEEAPTAIKGAISLTFPPDVLGPERPFCTSQAPPPRPIAGGFVYAPTPLRRPFAIVQGDADTVVPPGPAREFAARVPGARYIEVPALTHDFADFARWWPAFEREYARMSGTAAPAATSRVAALPLIEVPARGPDAAGGLDDVFAVFLSGDGGWADLDQQVAAGLARRGVPVVGWSSLKYFWDEKPPARAAADLDAVIRAYGTRWNRQRVLLVGYSFGADALPAMIAALPPATRARIAGFASIAGSTTASFKFSTLDWFDAGADTGPPVAPVIAALKLPTLCIYGRSDSGSLCPRLPPGTATVVALSGGHHIGGQFDAVVPPMLSLVRTPKPSAAGR